MRDALHSLLISVPSCLRESPGSQEKTSLAPPTEPFLFPPLPLLSPPEHSQDIHLEDQVPVFSNDRSHIADVSMVSPTDIFPIPNMCEVEEPSSSPCPQSEAPLSLLSLPEVSRQHSFLYTLQDIAILWSIFIENLYALVHYNLLPVFHPSATPGTPNVLLSPQPDWVLASVLLSFASNSPQFVCISSHEELEMLHESIRSSLVDLTTIITEYLTSTSCSSPLREHPGITIIASNPSLLCQITADITSTLHFSSTTPPIIFWEDGYYVPQGGFGPGGKGVVEEIQEKIYSFLYLSRIPLTEVSKVWKVSLHDLLRFVEKGYLEIYEGGWEGDEEDRDWKEKTADQEPTEKLIFEKSTGLSVYSSSASRWKKEQTRSGDSIGDGEMELGPFSSSLLTSSASLPSPLPSRTHLVMSDSRGLAASPPPFLTKCISRIDLYSQPLILQRTYLTNLQELCGTFGYHDLSELVVFLSHQLGSQGRSQRTHCNDDRLPIIEWGVEMFMITSELTEILLNWKLISLKTICDLLQDPSAPPTASQRRLEIHEIKERILTSRRRRQGGSRSEEEYYPIIDWLGESYVLRENLQEILGLFRIKQFKM